jgi:hypothetical protein
MNIHTSSDPLTTTVSRTSRSLLLRGFVPLSSKFLLILALAASMSGVCFGGHRGVPQPTPASTCATAAIQPIPPADNDPFISPTIINGFVFNSLGGHPIYNLEVSGLGIRFERFGLTIRLPQSSSYAIVELGVFSTDVVVEGFDFVGMPLFSVTVPHTGTSNKMVTVSGPNLATIQLTGGNNEGVVFSICAWN